MARKIKVYGTTTFLRGRLLAVAREKYGLRRDQVRIICGATSMAEANRMCEANELFHNTFRSDYTTETGNAVELELAGNGGIFIELTENRGLVKKENYHSVEELLKG